MKPGERKPTQGMICPGTDAIGLTTSGLNREEIEQYQEKPGPFKRLSDPSLSQPALPR